MMSSVYNTLLLFLENIMQETMEWVTSTVKIIGSALSNIHFADKINLVEGTDKGRKEARKIGGTSLCCKIYL